MYLLCHLSLTFYFGANCKSANQRHILQIYTSFCFYVYVSHVIDHKINLVKWQVFFLSFGQSIVFHVLSLGWISTDMVVVLTFAHWLS